MVDNAVFGWVMVCAQLKLFKTWKDVFLAFVIFLLINVAIARVFQVLNSKVYGITHFSFPHNAVFRPFSY